MLQYLHNNKKHCTAIYPAPKEVSSEEFSQHQIRLGREPLSVRVSISGSNSAEASFNWTLNCPRKQWDCLKNSGRCNLVLQARGSERPHLACWALERWVLHKPMQSGLQQPGLWLERWRRKSSKANCLGTLTLVVKSCLSRLI